MMELYLKIPENLSKKEEKDYERKKEYLYNLWKYMNACYCIHISDEEIVHSIISHQLLLHEYDVWDKRKRCTVHEMDIPSRDMFHRALLDMGVPLEYWTEDVLLSYEDFVHLYEYSVVYWKWPNRVEMLKEYNRR